MRSPTINELEARLEDYFNNHPNLYSGELELVKNLGYTVLRDDKTGKHKLKMGANYLKKVFGGVFSNTFGGSK